MSAMSLATCLVINFLIHQVSHAEMGCNPELIWGVGVDAALTLTLSVNVPLLCGCNSEVRNQPIFPTNRSNFPIRMTVITRDC